MPSNWSHTFLYKFFPTFKDLTFSSVLQLPRSSHISKGTLLGCGQGAASPQLQNGRVPVFMLIAAELHASQSPVFFPLQVQREKKFQINVLFSIDLTVKTYGNLI